MALSIEGNSRKLMEVSGLGMEESKEVKVQAIREALRCFSSFSSRLVVENDTSNVFAWVK